MVGRRATRSVEAAVLAVLCLLLVTSAAHAQPPPAASNDGAAAGDRAVALGQEGLAAFQEGNWPLALARFEEANTLSASPVFELYIARSLRNAARLLDARTRYRALI